MKKVIKRGNKRNNNIDRKFKVMFLVVFIMYLGSSIILKNYNISLNHKLQTVESNNATIQENNEILNVKIAELTSHERLNSIALANGLTTKKDSIKNAR